MGVVAVGMLSRAEWKPREGDDRLGRGQEVELTSYQAARPSLDGGVGWINTSGPIHLEELRGKVVVLDFWTYCCINCHHVLPDLAYLEQKYPNELVVIGVHTAKFDAEKSTDNIRKKVAEYRIKHPVINDANQVLWTRFGVNSWPTIVVLDANGNYVDQISGEGHRAVLDEFLGKLIAHHKKLGEISEVPIKFFPEAEKPHNESLLYPGKVVADDRSKRLFISDTGHNRIVVTDFEGKVQKVIGNGQEGLANGPYDKAQFNRPQGTCLVGETLYVADTENHAIRAINLKTERVETVAGNGRQANRGGRQVSARSTGLNSPWDVVLIPGTQSLAVAMAGPHQIWRFDLSADTIGVWYGSGVENIIDGPPGASAFAQPSGLATDGNFIYVADSEVSGIRAIPLGKMSGQAVQTVVGVNLFGFGDVDGRYPLVRLQHCLGLAYGDGKLFVADTYNNKIKVCDPGRRAVQSFLGTHEPGDRDEPPQFDEPGGLSVAGSKLFVADTNNHAIRVVDLKTKKVGTLPIEAPRPGVPVRRPTFSNPTQIPVPAASVEPGDKVQLDVQLNLPKGYKLNAEAPMSYLVESSGKDVTLGGDAGEIIGRIESPAEEFQITVPLAKPAEAGQSLPLKVSLSVFICREGSEGICKFPSFVWTIPVTFEEGAPDHLSLSTPKTKAAAP